MPFPVCYVGTISFAPPVRSPGQFAGIPDKRPSPVLNGIECRFHRFESQLPQFLFDCALAYILAVWQESPGRLYKES